MFLEKHDLRSWSFWFWFIDTISRHPFHFSFKENESSSSKIIYHLWTKHNKPAKHSGPNWAVQPSRFSWFVRLRTESGRNRIGRLPGRQWFKTQSLPVLFSKNVIFINTNRKQFWNELAWSSLSFTSDRKQTYLGN